MKGRVEGRSRGAHNPEVGGSNPPPATILLTGLEPLFLLALATFILVCLCLAVRCLGYCLLKVFLGLESFVGVFDLDAVSWNSKDFENRYYIVDPILKKLYLIDLFRLLSKVLYWIRELVASVQG